ncbi:MAG: hypothetical protein O2904_00430 [bacterium]|nr:hypothetical protein [bacterium]
MTKTRTSPDRELYGILGTFPDVSRLQSHWNTYFDKCNIDAFINKYPTTVSTIPERLSEMFHFDRRMYFIGPSLRLCICQYLDGIDCPEEHINCVVNIGGVFYGRCVDDPFNIEEVLATILT